MPRIVKAVSFKRRTPAAPTEKLDVIREANIAKHVELIDRAGSEGVQILCMQEIFTGPYFCAEQTTRWYEATERIPDGPTTKLMQTAREEARDGDRRSAVRGGIDRRLLQHRRRDRRRRHVPRQVPQESHSACGPGLLGEVLLSSPATSAIRCSRRKYADVGVYICYDRHFPEGARELGLNGAEIVFNPSATVAGLSEYLWKLEQPAHAVANAYFVGAINRVGTEAPWNIGEFYGQSYFCDPRGQIVAAGVARPDGADHRRARSRQDSRGAQRVAVLPRSAAGDVRWTYKTLI